MTLADLQRQINESNVRRSKILAQKNHDYTEGSGDPFANFRGAERRGITPELGIVLRIDDKLQRICTFLSRGTLEADDESVQDSIDDAQNYLDLLRGMITERQE